MWVRSRQNKQLSLSGSSIAVGCSTAPSSVHSKKILLGFCLGAILSTLLHPTVGVTGIMGRDDRVALADAANSASFAASGNIFCGLAGINASAQVVLVDDLLLTSAHLFYLNGNLRSQLAPGECHFKPVAGPFSGQKIPLKINTLRIYRGSPTVAHSTDSQFVFARDWTNDIALVRLDYGKLSSRIEPYALSETRINEPQMTHLAAITNANYQGRLNFNPTVQTCRVRHDLIENGALVLSTDCDTDPQAKGPSGSGLLRPKDPRDAYAHNSAWIVQGILSNTYSTSTGAYQERQNATIFIGITEPLLTWIENYSTQVR